jgi:hypothetical protein
MNSGVISFANTSVTGSGPPSRIFVPGGNIYWVGSGFSTSGLFQAQALTQDANNVYVQTSEAGGFPPAAASSPTFRTHPAPQFTCDDCTGDPVLVATNIQRGATPLAPLSEFSSRDFAPTSAQGNLGNLNAKGAIVSLTVNVTQAYDGTGAAVLRPTGQFHLSTVKRSDGTTFDWMPSINLKQAGERIITVGDGDGVLAPARPWDKLFYAARGSLDVKHLASMDNTLGAEPSRRHHHNSH